MKYNTDISTSGNLLYGGKLLEHLFNGVPKKFSPHSVFSKGGQASLWTAKLFSAHETMSSSFKATAEMISVLESKVIK